MVPMKENLVDIARCRDSPDQFAYSFRKPFASREKLRILQVYIRAGPRPPPIELYQFARALLRARIIDKEPLRSMKMQIF